MNSSLKTYLKSALSGELPGYRAHLKMLPPGRRLVRDNQDASAVVQSSVLLLVYPEGEQLYICLTKRPTTMKNHPGQISFPGGKVEDDDISAEAAALREAQEEVGVDPSSFEVLGKLSDLYVEVSKFSIQPFLAWADKKPDFEVNESEVEALILLPLTDFVRLEQVSEVELETITGMLRVKCYPYRNERIWGATAMILTELIELLRNQV